MHIAIHPVHLPNNVEQDRSEYMKQKKTNFSFM